VVVGAVDIDIVDDEGEGFRVVIYYYERVTTERRKKGSENARVGSGEVSADSNGSVWEPSEKEEAGVWEEAKPVWVERSVPRS
jgi:hypothetical protein